MKLSVAPAAQHELIEAAKFYAERAGEDFGLALIAEFEHALSLLSDNPELGASWQGSARRLPLRRFPYNLIYQLKPLELRVIALAHQRRRPGFWAERR